MVNYHDKASQSSESYRFGKVHAGNHGSSFPADTQGNTALEALSEECHIGQLLKHLQLKIKKAQKHQKVKSWKLLFCILELNHKSLSNFSGGLWEQSVNLLLGSISGTILTAMATLPEMAVSPAMVYNPCVFSAETALSLLRARVRVRMFRQRLPGLT